MAGVTYKAEGSSTWEIMSTEPMTSLAVEKVGLVFDGDGACEYLQNGLL